LNQNFKLLQVSTLLKGLRPEDIQTYVKENRFRLVSYKKNTVIHFEGEPCTSLEIILSGKVAVERIDESGGLLAIAEFYSDDILGGNLLFSRNPCYPMTITTQQPSVIVGIEKDLLFEIFCNNPAFLQMYLEYVSDHAFILGDKIKHYINKTIRESLMSFLKYESKKQNSNHVQLNMTKKALAEKIGVQRTSLSRELSKMKHDGLILFDAESVTILKNNQ
jgi:CRP-like cAMP-binding protein